MTRGALWADPGYRVANRGGEAVGSLTFLFSLRQRDTLNLALSKLNDRVQVIEGPSPSRERLSHSCGYSR